jgi:uncharacterized protein YigA (DUF484 family)
MSSIPGRLSGLSEDDIASYLMQTPGFFERHAELLANVELANPHGQRAVSLQQRQMEMLRERIHGLERRLMEMIRHGQENAVLSDRLHQWVRGLMLLADPRDIPDMLVIDLQEQFMVPQAAMRLWEVAPDFESEPVARGVSPELRRFASSLVTPCCGALLRDIDRLLQEETGLPVFVADDPLTCVVRGSGRALDKMDKVGTLFTND